MKRIFTLFWTLLIGLSLLAQSPQRMSYQAVVRNPSGTLVTNQSVGMRISIMQGSPDGTVVYREVYNPNPQTNANGLVTIVIGGGTPTIGTFSSINWAGGPYYLMTETDPSGGSTYTITGTTQLMSVPYALHANSVADYPESDPVFVASPSHGITSGNISNWNTAYGWGNHAGLYKPLDWFPSWPDVTGKPAFELVATTGNYNDLTNKPLLPMPGGVTGNIQFNNAGVLDADPEFTWDLNYKNLGIGISAPEYQLDVRGNHFRTINAETSHTAGAAVFGTGKDPGGRNAGVRGESYSTMGYGLYGDVLATSGVNYGVYGEVESPQGYSGFFRGGRFYIEGNTGIGVENPSVKLDVGGRMKINGGMGSAGGSLNGMLEIYGNSINEYPTLLLSEDVGYARATFRTMLASSKMWVLAGHTNQDDNSSQWHINYFNGSSGKNIISVFGNSDISIDGQVGIGINPTQYTLETWGNLNISSGRYGDALWCHGAQALWFDGTYFSWGFGGTYNYFADRVTIGNPANPGYMLYVSGNAYATGTWTSSDARFKSNIAEIDDPLEKVMSIRGTSFDFRADEFSDYQFAKGRQYGFIAQEVEGVLPEVVNTDSNGYKSVNYNGIIPVLLESVKEQQRQIEELKREIALLKAR